MPTLMDNAVTRHSEIAASASAAVGLAIDDSIDARVLRLVLRRDTCHQQSGINR